MPSAFLPTVRLPLRRSALVGAMLGLWVVGLIAGTGCHSRVAVPPPPTVLPPPVPVRDPNTIDPIGIVLHDSDTPARRGGERINAAWLAREHAEDHPGWAVTFEGKTYACGYHYVILPDGTVEVGRPERCIGAHARGHNDWIGICLVGGFSTHRHWFPSRPTEAQRDALVALCERLMSEYHIAPTYVCRHRDINDTWCPGDRFPYRHLMTTLRAYAVDNPQTQTPPGRVVSLAKPPPLHPHRTR